MLLSIINIRKLIEKCENTKAWPLVTDYWTENVLIMKTSEILLWLLTSVTQILFVMQAVYKLSSYLTNFTSHGSVPVSCWDEVPQTSIVSLSVDSVQSHCMKCMYTTDLPPVWCIMLNGSSFFVYTVGGLPLIRANKDISSSLSKEFISSNTS